MANTFTEELTEYYKENYNGLCKHAFYRSGKLLDPEDVVQETFARALRFKDSFKGGPQGIGGWVFTIMVNVIKGSMREGIVVENTVEYDEFYDEPCNMTVEEQQLVDEIQQLIWRKNEDVRQILYLYYFQEYKPRYITQVVEQTGSNVRQIIKRFKEEVKDEFERGDYM